MKLYIFNNGDPSVGIFPDQWEIQCPFNREDLMNEHDEDYFKDEMLKVFQQFCEFKVYGLYDYELKQEVYEGETPDYF
jgi:hypothetical protein